MAFTLERYTAVCRPLLAQKNCTTHRARKIILTCFAVVFLECTPWLGLTLVPKLEPNDEPGFEVCFCHLKRIINFVRAYFCVDFLFFYITPLIVSFAAYRKIAQAIKRSKKVRRSMAIYKKGKYASVRGQLGDSIRSLPQTTLFEVNSRRMSDGSFRPKIAPTNSQVSHLHTRIL